MIIVILSHASEWGYINISSPRNGASILHNSMVGTSRCLIQDAGVSNCTWLFGFRLLQRQHIGSHISAKGSSLFELNTYRPKSQDQDITKPNEQNGTAALGLYRFGGWGCVRASVCVSAHTCACILLCKRNWGERQVNWPDLQLTTKH